MTARRVIYNILSIQKIIFPLLGVQTRNELHVPCSVPENVVAPQPQYLAPCLTMATRLAPWPAASYQPWRIWPLCYSIGLAVSSMAKHLLIIFNLGIRTDSANATSPPRLAYALVIASQVHASTSVLAWVVATQRSFWNVDWYTFLRQRQVWENTLKLVVC